MQLSRIFLAVFVFVFSAYSLSAQMREDVLPKSFTLSAHLFPAPAASVLIFDSVNAAHLDRSDAKLGHMPKFARAITTDIGLANAGTWTTLSNGDRVWRCRLSAAGALGLIPCYDDLYLPLGAALHIYTPQRDEVLGAFTHDNNPAGGRYNTGLIHGTDCIIEYYEPASVTGTGRLHINELGYAYRMVPGYKASRDFGDASSCEVNVVCQPEGTNWQDQKNAVVRILVKTGSDFGWCSGTLMNNSSQDCTPYILSADHCYQDETNNYVSATAADLNQWIFYFNYESPTCANPAAQGTLGNHFISGCSFTAASLDNGGDNGSDFVLVKTNNSVPLAYNPYYAGWSNAAGAPHAGVCIHQPNGDIKKISAYSATLASSQWGLVVPDTHWEVAWAPTQNGYGVTEPGSSGSPIFDFSKRVVGTLTGGGSACNQPTVHDFYGKLAYDWSSNGVTSNKRLKDWLDPGNSGAVSMDGQYAPCSPTLSFDAAVSAIQQSGPVCDQSVTITTTLTNYGNQTLTDDSLTFEVDGGSPQVLTWSGSLNPLQSAQVSLPSQTFPIGAHTITVTSSSPDGNADGNPANDSKTSTFTVYPSVGHFTFTLVTGDRGADISWELIDANNTIAYAGGPYTNSSQTVTQSWCLPVGCYTFTIFSANGLGLKGIVTDGSYTIKDNSGTTVASLRNVNFGNQEATNNICSNAVAGIHDIPESLAGITIYPNPSSGQFIISNLNDANTLTVTDALGRLITSASLKGATTQQVDLSAQESGVYFFHFVADAGTVTRKVVLNKGR